MFSTIEVIIEKNGSVRLLEPLPLGRQMRALLTLLEPLNKPAPKRPLREFIGILKNSNAFDGDPVALQRMMRDEWD